MLSNLPIQTKLLPATCAAERFLLRGITPELQEYTKIEINFGDIILKEVVVVVVVVIYLFTRHIKNRTQVTQIEKSQFNFKFNE